MWKNVLCFSLVCTALSLCVYSASAGGYRYIDDSGNIYFVDRPEQIPMKYRWQVFPPTAVPTCEGHHCHVKAMKSPKPTPSPRPTKTPRIKKLRITPTPYQRLGSRLQQPLAAGANAAPPPPPPLPQAVPPAISTPLPPPAR